MHPDVLNSVKPNHAQTNLQLYNQLTSLGWDEPALVLVRDAYGLASQLFSGQVRPTGKTFISHLVGTASVLASVGEHPTVVAAGLLHAAYAEGEFGDGSRGFSPHKRRTLVEAAGTYVECLVAVYTHLPWHPSLLAGLAANLDAEPREVVLIRLANEVDDWADGGLRYYEAIRPGALLARSTHSHRRPARCAADGRSAPAGRRVRRVGRGPGGARPADPGVVPGSPRSYRPRTDRGDPQRAAGCDGEADHLRGAAMGVPVPSRAVCP